MKLEAKRVHEIFRECLFTDEEPKTNYVLAEGVQMTAGFHPERIKAHADEIGQLLAELPDGFSKGGGWTFLNACMDRQDHQWGEHQNVDQLLMLGLATKQIEYCMPREMWSALPAGMPYFKVVTPK